MEETTNNRLVALGLLTQDWADFSSTFDLVKEVFGSIYTAPYWPKTDNIFRAFKECPVKDLKVIILGQDPYHDGSATGLAFDNLTVQKRISPSLKNILAEMNDDLGTIAGWQGSEQSVRADTHLGHLPQQGVLLLNTALTVEAGNAGSHTELWQPFTKQLITDLNKKDNLVWMLWGNHAKAYKAFITNPTHLILEGGHPSPLNRKHDFAGGNYFSKANSFLTSVGQTSIQW